MKIATWNLERLKKRKNQAIIEKLVETNADIIVLTETNSFLQLDGYYDISTALLPSQFDGIPYEKGEIRVRILTKYQIINCHETYDPYTSVCVDIETPFGPLTVYGSIIGVFGNRQPRFDTDLNGHLSDFEKIFPGRPVCLIGDLNVTFSGQPWPSQKARQTLLEAFEKFGLSNTTASLFGAVDHIVLSQDFLENKQIKVENWNTNKKLSDHEGYLVTLSD